MEISGLDRRDDHFPWGIIALACDQLGETAWVDRWIENSNSLKHSAYWTVLDETLLQIFAARYALRNRQ